jgi:hypothetical protein
MVAAATAILKDINLSNTSDESAGEIQCWPVRTGWFPIKY